MAVVDSAAVKVRHMHLLRAPLQRQFSAHFQRFHSWLLVSLFLSFEEAMVAIPLSIPTSSVPSFGSFRFCF